MALFLLGLAVLILVSLFVAGLYVALQRKNQDEEKTPQIHHSGVYRLRRSPRDGLLLAKPSEKEIRERMHELEMPDSDSEALIASWNEQLEANLRVIEDADLREIKTFQYEIPPRQTEVLALLPPGTYVTRDQLTNHPHLIPPFQLGCKAILRAKNAWEGQDWQPLLPAREGRYEVPDWRTFVR